MIGVDCVRCFSICDQMHHLTHGNYLFFDLGHLLAKFGSMA